MDQAGDVSTRFDQIDMAVVVVYVLAVVVFGAYFVRKSNTTEGFTVGGRSMPGWAVGLSILGTFLSSISFLALPGKAYTTNWNFFVFSLTLPVAAGVAVVFFLPIYRRRGLVSAYEFLEERLGLGGRTYASVCFVLLQVVRTGAILYLVAVAMQPMIGGELYQIILIAGVLITLYTFLGGIEAVIWTDVVQVIVLFGGAVFTAVLLLWFSFPGGPSQLFTIAHEHAKFSWGSTDWDLTAGTVWTVVIYGLAENLKNFGVDQTYVQRYISARSNRAAARALWLGALAYIPMAALFFFIGAALFAFYQVNPDQLPDSIRGQGDKIFPFFIQQQLPVGVRGLLIAAILAAAMSTVDSGINSASTVCMVDFYKRRIRPDANDRQSLRVVRMMTLVLGVVGTLAGLAMIVIVQYRENALDAWWELAGIIGGPFLGLFLLAVMVRRLPSWGVFASLVVGLLTVAWVSSSKHLPEDYEAYRCHWHGLMAGPAGTLAMVVTGLFLAGFRATAPGGNDESQMTKVK